MTLLERLRSSRPAWQHPDAALRAEAVRQLPAQEQTLLAEIARGDADARVRRAALRKLGDAKTLAEVAAAEVDAEVREEAAESLMAWAAGENADAARVALEALSDPRRLAHLARAARLQDVRRAAVARLEDPRLLATLAKIADDPGVRAAALARLMDPAAIIEVASKTGHKDVAMAAVDRIEDPVVLRGIAERARHKAASRRALARLATRMAAASEAPLAASPEAVEEPAVEPSYEDEAEPAAAEPVEHAAAAEDGAAERPSDFDPPSPVAESSEAGSLEPEIGHTPAAPSEPSGASAPLEPRPAEDAARHAQRAQGAALCDRLQSLAEKPDLALKDAEEALREARALLAAATAALPGRLLHRLKDARQTLFARAQELRDADEWSRWGNAAVQEELCARMEALATRDDPERVARELREADDRWARFRHAPKDQAETLRQRYQAARALVKARLDAYFARKTAEERAHLEAKRALCEEAEKWAQSTEWLKGSDALKGLQARWKEVGAVPHRQSEAVWRRFRAACDSFFTRRNEDLRQRKAHWTANLTRKEELCARAEALASSSDWEPAAAELKRLQTEWKSVGAVRKAKADAVWKRFRTACDAFFERYKNRDALEQAAKAAQREALCVELEALLPAEGREAQAPEAVLEAFQSLQARWRQAPRLAPDAAAASERRFAELRTRLLAARPEAFRGSELDLALARARKEKLWARVEKLVAGSQASSVELSGEALARRLKEALAGNTIGGAELVEARRRAELEEVEAARTAWQRLPPLTGDDGEALERRFAEACERLLRERRPASDRSPAQPRPKPDRPRRPPRRP